MTNGASVLAAKSNAWLAPAAESSLSATKADASTAIAATSMNRSSRARQKEDQRSSFQPRRTARAARPLAGGSPMAVRE